MDEQAQLVQRHKCLLDSIAVNRDIEAFTELFKYYAPKIRVYGIQRLGQQGLVQDLIQETMTTIWLKSHLYNPSKGAVNTWIFTIMRNQCFDMLRRVQHNREEAFGDEIWPLFENFSVSDEIPDFMLSASLIKHIDKLPSSQKQIIQGVYLQDLSQQQLADKLGIPIGTVKSRLRLGLEKLRCFMEKYHD